MTRPVGIRLHRVRFAHEGEPHREPLAVLDGMDTTFPSASVSVLMGPSGCGKTTVLNILAGLISPTEGDVTFSGGDRPPIGFVFQTPSLIPWRTVIDNVLFGVELRKTRHASPKDEARKLLYRYGLDEFTLAYPDTLSGGMQQRVSLVRALLSGARLLLLDEPFSALDLFTRIDLEGHVSQMVDAEGITSVMVTHDLDEAMRIGDKIIVLTGRPARIEAEIDIPIPRARRLADREIGDDVMPYFRQVSKALRAVREHER